MLKGKARLRCVKKKSDSRLEEFCSLFCAVFIVCLEVKDCPKHSKIYLEAWSYRKGLGSLVG